MAMSKFFRIPFATSGDKVAVPDASQPSGSVSYTDGFGPDYELDPGVDPAAKDVPRDETNQLYFDITNAIKEYQEFGVPDFITSALNGGSPFSYARYARVKWTDGKVYESRIDSNTTDPSNATNWRVITDNVDYLTIATTAFQASVTDGEAVYWDGTQFDEAIADGTNKQNVIGFADVTNGRVFVAGLYAGQLSGLTANTPYYLSTSSAGAITTVQPASNAVQIGVARTSTSMYVNIYAVNTQTVLAGYKSGLTISNNVTDANNDIDFAPGVATERLGTRYINLASTITKRLDAAWSAGNGNGGLFSGSKAASTWYHCFVIINTTTGVSDAGFDTSLTGANAPVGYLVRRVGSILTDGSGNIRAFTQNGNDFWWTTPIADVSGVTLTTTSQTFTVSAPPGFDKKVIGSLSTSGGNDTIAYVRNPASPDTLPSLTTPFTVGNSTNNTVDNIAHQLTVLANTSSQIAIRVSSASVTGYFFTNGWSEPNF